MKDEIASAYARGYRLKVAVIATVNDLGAVPSLFGKPHDYATFLGQELRFYYGGPLLVVMPNGLGVYDAGRSTVAEDKVIAGLTVKGGSADDLTSSAARAVRALTTAGALVSKDITPPYAGMVPTTVKRGTRGTLRFAIADDSKKATALIRIFYGARRIASFSFRYQAAVLGRSRIATWVAPRSLQPGTVRACLAAADLSGNHSHISCAPVTVV